MCLNPPPLATASALLWPIASQTSGGSSWPYVPGSTPTGVTTEPTTSGYPTEPPHTKYPNCTAYPLANVGDGWCDSHAPFNTQDCGYDGGDCCESMSQRFDCHDPTHAAYNSSSPRGKFPAPTNPRYSVPERELTHRDVATGYTNFYEIGYSKSLRASAAPHASFFQRRSWVITVNGLVDRPLRLDVGQLMERFVLETRVYRHRCVEAWGITVPWLGFPLASLLAEVQPKTAAKWVQFTSFNAPSRFPNQQDSHYPFPYTEALSMDEAMNELAFISVGMYGKPLPPQNGAPLRLTVPWKYGFKSIKSIATITLTSRRPATFWSTAGPSEYGVWANVNPWVPHARWSQATERLLIDDAYSTTRVQTMRFNGYEDHVGYIYKDFPPDEDLWH